MKKYFEEQPTTREEQVEVLKKLLSNSFRSMYPKESDLPPNLVNYNAPNPYEHAEMCYIYTRFAAFIRTEDNSLLGFRTRCPASFSPTS